MKTCKSITLVTITTILLLYSSLVNGRIFSSGPEIEYKVNESVPVYMNMMRSDLMWYDYYYKGLYPQPKKIEDHDSFIFNLSGNKKRTSLIQIDSFLQNIPCTPLVKGNTTESSYTTLSAPQSNDFINLIKNQFRAHFYIDDLPIGHRFGDNLNYLGYSMGLHLNNQTVIYNHLDITIYYNEVPGVDSGSAGDRKFWLVGVNVIVLSVDYTKTPLSMCNTPNYTLALTEDTENKVLFTYSVNFTPLDVTWNDRFDIYYSNYSSFVTTSIIYGFLLVLILSLAVVVIFMRIYKKNAYGILGADESGWKAIYADVFRSPNNFMTFSIITGFGVQIVASAFILMVFSVGGFLSIANPGGLSFAIIIIFSTCSIFNGYVSMRTYIMMGGTRKTYNAVMTAFLLPGLSLILVFIGNIQIWSNKYTYAATGFDVFIVLLLWLFLSVPLSLMSSYFVKNWPPSGYPCATNHIPRFIPITKWYHNTAIQSFLSGVIPFGIINNQLFFFLSGIVRNTHYQYSYGFGFSLILMIISIIELNIIIEFYQLSMENYSWWWRSLLGPSSTGFYTFVYFVYFGISKMYHGGANFYYFILSLIFSLLVAFFCSSISFLCSLWFTKKIYSTLHFE
ncbi:hypothetical protein DLAC_11841 [Tieghemostelium lacteum]|uniref:Transmembrane 9 superfamily member n=1 Tax=Tieghemostelium lacteum TaxID=361077 RepID=A0A151Z382_TIELA|nr:hypothetical protein DLAC_11841 [Tieghemostelium lacteum]|eukprot:KYQ88387.1 hypothetical protein DLAC_11841 [Tieghemostelium lacteum]